MKSSERLPQDAPSNPASKTDQLLVQAFAKLDSLALGIAVGVWMGLAISGATIVLLLQGGLDVGPRLGLLSQYFPGYSVTWSGSLVGLAYGFVFGLALGWLAGTLRNLFVVGYLHSIRVKARISSLNDFLDQP